ncbi:unnamed protein product [Ectocarpus sp. 12 AP-2014]
MPLCSDAARSHRLESWSSPRVAASSAPDPPRRGEEDSETPAPHHQGRGDLDLLQRFTAIKQAATLGGVCPTTNATFSNGQHERKVSAPPSSANFSSLSFFEGELLNF